jgi:antitoxin YefM
MLNEETTYTQLRENLATQLAKVLDDNTIVVVKRRDGKDVALIAADELSSLLETVHLLRSQKNARRLFDALERSRLYSTAPSTIDELYEDLGIEPPPADR